MGPFPPKMMKLCQRNIESLNIEQENYRRTEKQVNIKNKFKQYVYKKTE